MTSRRPLVVILVAACYGHIDPLPPHNGSPEPQQGLDSSSPCLDPVATQVDGHHNPGLDCAGAGCHAAGGDGPTFSLGGTLYSDLAGSAPVAGAWVHVVDAGGQELVLETALNGNFWTDLPVAFPVRTWASSCPSAAEMISPAGPTCNAAGCHGPGARVHLP